MISVTGVPGLRANVAGRSGDPPRLCWEGKLELSEALRSETAAEGIPESFHPAEFGRVAPEAREQLIPVTPVSWAIP